MAAVEPRAVDLGVEGGGLPGVAAADHLEAALGLHPAGNETEDVDAEGVGRVVARSVLRLHRVVQHRGQRGRRTRQQILPDYDERDARWSQILLTAGIEHAEPR